MDFNHAYSKAFPSGGMTIGLLSPAGRQPGQMPDLATEQQIARMADAHGFAALWVRDVPLLVPQGSGNEVSELDDPFLWLTALASVTTGIALGTSAIVLPLRHPLHVAKSALSLDRLSRERLLLGVGSGDRPEEFEAFGVDLARRGEIFRSHWKVLRAALSPKPSDRGPLLELTAGRELAPAPTKKIPLFVVGSARQSLQWIAANSDGWASYHREDLRQQGRLALWANALSERAKDLRKPFIQSVHLELLEDKNAPATEQELGISAGRVALTAYLLRLRSVGVAHVILQLARTSRPALDVVDEIGREVLPCLRACATLDH